MKRLAAGLLAIAAIVAAWWLIGAEERVEPRVVREQARAEAERPPERARRPPAPAVAPEHEAVAEAARPAGADGGAPGASLVEQLIAIHEIGSQADVSAFLQRNAELAAKHVDAYCAEASKVANPLGRPGNERDAAGFLAPLVDWATKPPRQGRLHLADALVARIDAAGAGWPAVLTESDLAGLDFDWMSRLHDFDHWTLLGAGPVTEPNGPPLDEALPYYVTLLHWTKLRYARALKYGDADAARRDVHHLATLVRSQGVLLAEMIAVVMVRIGVEAGLEPFAPADIERLRRYTRHADSFFFPGVAPEVMKKAAGCAPAPCTAMFEGAYLWYAMGELSPDDTSDALWPLIDQAGCDRRLLDHIPTQSLPAQKAKDVFSGPPALERLFDVPR